MNPNLQNLISQLTSMLPMLLIWLVGAVLALVNWHRCPTPSLLVLLAMLDFAFFRVLSSLFVVFVYPALREGGNPQNASTIMSVVGFVTTLGAIVGYIMLLAAVFIGRGNPTSQFGASSQFGPKPML